MLWFTALLIFIAIITLHLAVPVHGQGTFSCYGCDCQSTYGYTAVGGNPGFCSRCQNPVLESDNAACPAGTFATGMNIYGVWGWGRVWWLQFTCSDGSSTADFADNSVQTVVNFGYGPNLAPLSCPFPNGIDYIAGSGGAGLDCMINPCDGQYYGHDRAGGDTCGGGNPFKCTCAPGSRLRGIAPMDRYCQTKCHMPGADDNGYGSAIGYYCDCSIGTFNTICGPYCPEGAPTHFDSRCNAFLRPRYV